MRSSPQGTRELTNTPETEDLSTLNGAESEHFLYFIERYVVYIDGHAPFPFSIKYEGITKPLPGYLLMMMNHLSIREEIGVEESYPLAEAPQLM